MLLERKITLYRNVRDRVGRPGTFAEFLQLCLESREAVEAMRATNPDERRQLKQNLPCATLSGQFEPSRTTQNLVQHSGLICLDFDHVPDCAGLIDRLSRLDIVAYASRSCSGNGVFCVVPIAFPDRHREHFTALERYFGERGVEVDGQCSDVTRLRVVSYDQDAVLRPDAVAFRGLWREPRQTFQLRPRAFDADKTLARVQYCVEQIVAGGVDVTEIYDDWMRVAMSLGSLGEEGREFFHVVSSQSPKYNAALCDKKFTECQNARNIGVGTFFEICRQHGITCRNG